MGTIDNELIFSYLLYSNNIVGKMLIWWSKIGTEKDGYFVVGNAKFDVFTPSHLLFCDTAIKIIKLCNRDRGILRVNLFLIPFIKSSHLRIFKVDTNLRRLLEKEAMVTLPKPKGNVTLLMLLSKRSLTCFIVFQRQGGFSDK